MRELPAPVHASIMQIASIGAQWRMPVDFKDIASRMKKVRDQNAPEADKPFDHTEAYRLRGKMLGVLIRDARIAAARSVQECARLLRVEPAVIEAWEFGEDVPSLPQLELLAYYLDVPLSHFWGQKTLEENPESMAERQPEYIVLRQRIVAALLRQAREERELSIADVAAHAEIDEADIARYEAGEVAIPLNHLTVLASVVDRNMNYFTEATGHIGQMLQSREEWKRFVELDDDVRQFVSNPVNIGFIKIAMMFSQMPTDDLRKVGASMLDISM